MKAFDALTYKDQKGSFNNEDEQLLLSLLKGTSGKVLDIGCGDGLLTVQAKESMPEAQIVAIDNSPEQIQLATKNDAEGIEFAEADITNLSREEIFDGAYSFYAFPHIPKSKIPSALVSVRNVLKPGGKFYLFTNICLFDSSLATEADQEACDIVFLNEWPSQINLIDLEQMREMFTAAGFKEVDNKMLKTGAKVKNYGEMISWLFVLE
jgi:ubiquinone/menaquinone biosynthesis C-methylase UbiE